MRFYEKYGTSVPSRSPRHATTGLLTLVASSQIPYLPGNPLLFWGQNVGNDKA